MTSTSRSVPTATILDHGRVSILTADCSGWRRRKFRATSPKPELKSAWILAHQNRAVGARRFGDRLERGRHVAALA
jgi:hypothetical protein